MNCERTSELGAAYALDALDEPERTLLEAHVHHCPSCAQQLRELQEVTAQLALALPQHEPPAGLGRRIAALAANEMRGETRASPSLRPSTSRSSFRWALASLALAAGSLLWAVSLQAQLSQTRRELAETSSQLERTRGSYSTVVRVLASAQSETRELQPTESAPSALGKVWIDRSSGQAMMMARDLPALSEDQTYQVWLISAQQERVSAGFLRRFYEGPYYLVLQAPGKLADYERLGVTREPAGGSPGPTGPRIIGGEI